MQFFYDSGNITYDVFRTLLSVFANLPSGFFLRAPLFGLKCAQRCNASDLTMDDTGGRKRKMTWFCCE